MKVALNRQSIDKQIIKSANVFYPSANLGDRKDDRFTKLSKGQYWENTEVTIADLADHIQQGFAWMPSCIDWKNDSDLKDKTAENCNYAELLGADVDNSDFERDAQGILIKDVNGQNIKIYKPLLTLDQALEHPFIKSHAALIIPSSSHTDEWHKFRIVFVLCEALTSRKQIESAYKYLLEILPCADKACKNSDRFYYGAKDKPIVLINELAELPEDFALNVFDYEEDQVRKEQERIAKRQHWASQNNATDDTERLILDALNCIPSRQVGSNTYLALRDCLWALISHCGESKAISIIESHSPSHGSWDVAKIASKYDAARSVGIGTLFYHASQNGFKFPDKPSKGSAIPSASKVLASNGIDTKSKAYTVQFVHLCDRHVQRILLGESESVTMALILKVYRELKGWENAIAKFYPDTVATTSIENMIARVCDRNDFDEILVKAEIAKISRPSLLMPIGKADAIKKWRVKFLDSGTDEEKAKFDKQQQVFLRDRVFAGLRDDLRFNLQIAEWFGYDSGVFILKSKEEITAIIRDALRDLSVADWSLSVPTITEKRINEEISKIKSSLLVKKFDEAKVTANLINLKDCVYDRKKQEVLPHSQDYGFTVQLPYKWSDAETVSAAPIVQWLYWALDGKIDQVYFAMCYLNAIVCRRSDIQVLLQVIGKGGSGKSTFTKLATALVGDANTQSTQIELLDNQFESSNFIGKPLIVINETGNYRGNGSVLKNLTGGDKLRNESKNIQARNNGFVFKGKVLLTANKELKPIGVADDWDRRNRTLHFDRVISTDKQENLLEQNDDGFAEGNFAECLPAFLKLILSIPDEMVKKVLVQTIDYVPSLNDSRTDSILYENSIAQWAESNLILNPQAVTYVGNAEKLARTVTYDGVSTTRTEYARSDELLHANYAQYCFGRGIVAIGFQRFSRELLLLFNGTLKNETIKRANRTERGAAIIGLEIRISSATHQQIKTPIKNLLIDLLIADDNLSTETLGNVNTDDNVDKIANYKYFLKNYISDLISDLSSSDICTPVSSTDNINNTNNLIVSKSINIIDSINSSKGSDDQPINSHQHFYQQEGLKQGDVVVVDIADIEAAKYVAQQCKVALWFSEYTVERLATIHGAEMAYISNGKPVEMPICIEYLRKVATHA